MKTYSVRVLREAIYSLIDTDKYIKFSVYIHPFISVFGKTNGKKIGGQPQKLKGKLDRILGTQRGLAIIFKQCWFNRRACSKETSPILLKDIRWIDSLFDEKKLEDICINLTKKLKASKN